MIHRSKHKNSSKYLGIGGQILVRVLTSDSLLLQTDLIENGFPLNGSRLLQEAKGRRVDTITISHDPLISLQNELTSTV